MNDQPIIKDERTKSVENASYKPGFIIICFGLLIDIIIRSFFYNEAPWDLFALVIVGSWASTIYQARQKILPPNFWRSMLILGVATAVLSAVLVFVIAKLR